ncbi:MAG: ferric reductase-like transmembrane domain-containing protein [Phycisphaeraceae bacterium]|nr:ferric reductase-like transmembrane domain-containing protein [Phycisphaeraceae bacterium]
MSASYRLVQWNRHKRLYDLTMVSGVALYLLAFIAVGKLAWRGRHAISDEILLIRALATCALVMLTIILCIGPLARLWPRAAPLLYNRRHLGVCMFLVALAHAALATLYYGAFGGRNPIVATLVESGGVTSFASISGFRFEVLGFLALLILFLMAATSHDFWLANLSPRIWKSLHMLVYAAYALIIMHVALGILQSERSLLYPILLAISISLVSSLHLIAGRRELARDRAAIPIPPAPAWIDAGAVDDIPDNRAASICIKRAGNSPPARVAVFRHNGSISAVSDTCAHQGGPLSEGKVIDGCITCPWHGYQYLPASGQSPPPFTERIPTYQVRIEGRRILINPDPLPPGTPVPPARFEPLEPAHA